MAKFIKGDIVLIPFSFSNLSGSKKHPELVLSNLNGDDIILCQITNRNSDNLRIMINNNNFLNGSLPITSFIRPIRIFTTDKNIIIRKAGTINENVKMLKFDLILQLIKYLIIIKFNFSVDLTILLIFDNF